MATKQQVSFWRQQRGGQQQWEQIRDKTYVDNGLAGGSPEEVAGWKGQQEDGKDGNILQILATCGLKVKYLVETGDKRPEAAEHLGGKVLGISYEVTISYTIPLKFNLRSRPGHKKTVFLGPKEVQDIRSGGCSLSRREALSFCAGVYEPLGHIGPALLRGRLLLQRLHGAGGTWDSDILEEERVSWGDWFQELASETRINLMQNSEAKGGQGQANPGRICRR